MFVCVTALFICLANKCIINKPPAACFFFFFFSPAGGFLLRLHQRRSIHVQMRRVTTERSLPRAPPRAPKWGWNSVVQDSLARAKPGEVSHLGAQTFEGKKKRTPARTNAKSLTKVLRQTQAQVVFMYYAGSLSSLSSTNGAITAAR